MRAVRNSYEISVLKAEGSIPFEISTSKQNYDIIMDAEHIVCGSFDGM
jgi:hypothetical protein